MAARLRGAYGHLGGWPPPGKLPIVYHPQYNISFFGIENLHPFDSKKYKKVRLGFWTINALGLGSAKDSS